MLPITAVRISLGRLDEMSNGSLEVLTRCLGKTADTQDLCVDGGDV